LAGRGRDRSRRPDSWPAPPWISLGAPFGVARSPADRPRNGGRHELQRVAASADRRGAASSRGSKVAAGSVHMAAGGSSRPPQGADPRYDPAGLESLRGATSHGIISLASRCRARRDRRITTRGSRGGAWTEPGRCLPPKRPRDPGPVRAAARRAVTGFPAGPSHGDAVRRRLRGARTATRSVSGRGAIPGGGQRDAPRRAGSRALFPVPREPGVKGPYTVRESTGDRRPHAEPSSAVWRCRPAAEARSKAIAPSHAIPATSHSSHDSRRPSCAAPRP